MNRTIIWVLNIIVAAAGFCACKKSGPTIYLPADTGYASRIGFLLQYNQAEFQTYDSDLIHLGLADSLNTKGPFTVFAYNSQAPIQAYGSQYYAGGDTAYTHVSIIPGRYPLDSISPGETEVINGPNGFKWVITANIVNGQVQYTVNGAPVLKSDQHASNGLIDVMTNVYSPNCYPSLLTAIRASESYIDFAYALQRTHLDSLLADSTQSYTVFAPTSLGGLNAVRTADLDSLTNLVKYSIVPGRLFGTSVAFLYNPNADTLYLPTLTGENLLFIFNGLPDPTQNNYGSVTGPGNSNPLGAVGTGIPAGAGVLQSLNSPLLP